MIMAVIGEFIKAAIAISDKVISDPDPVRAQKTLLKKLLEKAKGTAFGREYAFDVILESGEREKVFQETVPVHDYDQIHGKWWHRSLKGEEDVTWPGKTEYFAVSSGTTSKSKHIPVTAEMLSAIRKSGLRLIMSMPDFGLPASFFEKEMLVLGSSTSLEEKNNHLEGEISGISAGNIPFWLRDYYRPGLEVTGIRDWDERVRQIVLRAPQWNIGSVIGIPSWIEMMLKEVIRYYKLENIHEIWPGLEVFVSGGVAFEPYLKSLERLFARPLTYIDTYLASEGFLAVQKRPGTSSMALLTDNGIYFEFVPFEEKNMSNRGTVRPGAEVLGLEQVEEGKDYVLLISTVGGAWRYMIGDIVAFTDKARAEIKITGRTTHYLNVVGSQLTEDQMNNAIAALEDRYDTSMQEFTVAAVRNENDDYIHKWYLSCDKALDKAEVAEVLDQILRDLNINYHVARAKGLKDVEVELVPVDIFYKWSEVNKKLGDQVKIPRVMKEETFREWEAFVNKIHPAAPA